jgi:uncharacterized protein (DUF488 family)
MEKRMPDIQHDMKLTIYTIGHSNVTADKIIELLGKYNVQSVVDVRTSPYSKYAPQFNREMLELFLKRAGIDYYYAGKKLGGRPSDPSCYKDGQVPPDGNADFLRLVDYPMVMTKSWYQQGIQQLIENGKQKLTAVMCSEEDPAHCHRQHLISQTLLKMDTEVLHIRGKGHLEKAWLLPDPSSKEEQPQQLMLF